MARRVSGEQREANTNGRRASVAEMDGVVGSTNGRAEAHAEGQDHLHQQIAELAYVLYERSGALAGSATGNQEGARPRHVTRLTGFRPTASGRMTVL